MKQITVQSLLLSTLLITGCGGGSSSNDSSSDTNSATTQEETNITPTPTPTETQESESITEEVVEEIAPTATVITSPIPHTNQTSCFNANGTEVTCTNSGQDGAYLNNLPSYTQNSDGTVTDNITGLMWQQTPDNNNDGTINSSDKMSQSEAESYCNALSLGSYDDWRLPDIKTMYSLIDFNGQDVSNYEGSDTLSLNPFIDTNAFDFGYGDVDAGERIIDAQWATTSIYIASESTRSQTMFGVNLADGRIKSYPVAGSYYVQCVRDNTDYGTNRFVNNGDQTVSDSSTHLMWQKEDSQNELNWEDAIDYCEALDLANYSDWRLPNAKELQSIVDYTKSPDTTNSAAIDTDYFNATLIINENAEDDYGFYWASTTHQNMMNGKNAVYLSFGRALGYMNSQWIDVHGAGAQRSDPKDIDGVIDPSYTTVTTQTGETVYTHGPQGDVIRGYNFARCVRSPK